MAKSDYPVARRVDISVGPLASTRTKNEESAIQGPRARAHELRGDYFGFCSDARRRYAVQKNGTGPFLSRASDRGISFFIFHRRRRRRTICFAAWRAPVKTGDYRLVMADCRTPKGWWRWRSGHDDAVLPVFLPCENATSENSIFHRGIQDVARYDAVSDKSRKAEILLKR